MTNTPYIYNWKVSLGVLTLTLCVAYYSMSQNENHFIAESSVWCVNDVKGNKMCQFQNVCYNSSTQTFSLYLGDKSTIRGLANHSELQRIQLSSVRDHNRFYANFTVHRFNWDGQIPDALISKAIAFVRFKPDNLMHVIHDDLLPLHGTLEQICKCDSWKCLKSFQLFFLDDNSEGPYSFLYQIFSNNAIEYASISSNKLICFEELHLGLNTESVWYQYGFKNQRAPIEIKNFNFEALLKFRQFVLENIIVNTDENHVLLLERPSSRKILNADFVKDSLKNYYQKGDVLHVNATIESTTKLIQLVANADALIGIHGAEMILSIFMKPQGKIIELFPYGVAPEVVSFLQPLAFFPNSPYSYFSWENLNRSNTVRHPEYPPNRGGLNHLSFEERIRISSIERVQKVYCCNDPAFLHLIYQDTVVGPEIVKVILKALFSFKAPYSPHNVWMYPARVLFPSCFLSDEGASISWCPPENFDSKSVYYSITVSAGKTNLAFVTSDTHLLLRGVTGIVSVWISAVLNSNNNSSPDTFVQCTLKGN